MFVPATKVSRKDMVLFGNPSIRKLAASAGITDPMVRPGIIGLWRTSNLNVRH